MKNQKVLIGSDWHWDHNNILLYTQRFDFMSSLELKATKRIIASGERGRVRYSKDTIERMNTAIIDDCNEQAGENDIIWNAGDVLFGPKDPDHFYERLLELRSRIVCKNINLVLGNHDEKLRPTHLQTNHENYQKRNRPLTDEQIYNIFNEVHQKVMIKVRGQRILIDHTMHAVWEGNHRGVWHCYGHSHSTAEKARTTIFPDAKMLDVGIDNAARLGLGYKLFNVEGWLKKFMDGQKGQALDHHK